MDLLASIIPLLAASISVIVSFSSSILLKKEYDKKMKKHKEIKKMIKNMKNEEVKLKIEINDSELEIKENDKQEVIELLSKLQYENNPLPK